MAWFGVRCVFEFRQRGLFEERVTLWDASTFEEAIERAEREAHDYAGDETSYVGLAQAYGPLDDDPADGVEVFSLMRSSELDAEAYVSRFLSTGQEREGEVRADRDLGAEREA